MIITRTPFRVSFFGGGTDFPAFYNECGGAVLSAAIDKYCYVHLRRLPRFFSYRSELCYAVTERVSSVEEIQHPAIREAMKMLDLSDIRLSYEADLPARSGLGTSSSFAVGMLHAFHVLKREQVDRRGLADEAIELERARCREAGGVQDQIAAAFGGVNQIRFGAGGYTVEPIPIGEARKQALNDRLLLYFTGISRYSFTIQEKTQEKLGEKRAVLLKMRDLAEDARRILLAGDDLDAFGALLEESWHLKRGVNPCISTESIDALLKTARRAGALGGKLLGAGGGGFLLLYAAPDKQPAVRRALKDYLEVPFRFDEMGTTLLYDSPDSGAN